MVICICSIEFEFCILFVIRHLHLANTNQTIKHRLSTETEMGLTENYNSSIDYTRSELEELSSNYELSKGSPSKNSKSSTIDIIDEKGWRKLMGVFIYGILWLFFMFLTVIYLISKSLPEDNIIGLNSTLSTIVSGSIALILTLNDMYIIPGFVKLSLSFCKSCK